MADSKYQVTVENFPSDGEDYFVLQVWHNGAWRWLYKNKDPNKVAERFEKNATKGSKCEWVF